MTSRDADFLESLLATFRIEAEEHVAAICSGLVELENGPIRERQAEIVETVFRDSHSLKGAARAVSLSKVESICQSLETIFAEIKEPGRTLPRELFDRLHQMIGAVSQEIARAAGAPSPASPALETVVVEPTDKFKTSVSRAKQPEHLSSPLPSAPPPLPEERAGLADTVRIAVPKLNSILRRAEELAASKAMAGFRANEIRDILCSLDMMKKDWHRVRPHVRALRRAVEPDPNQPSSLVLACCERNEQVMESVSRQLANLGAKLDNDRRILERRVDDLLDDVKRASMVPFSGLFAGLPKLVRDLSRDCGKDAELVLQGGEIEVSRRILNEIKDPLIHLVRNCIDHGIGSATERQLSGKPGRATITIAVSPKIGGRVEMVISDDGEGIDIAKVLATAVAKGLLSPVEARAAAERQSLALIFQSGFSTSPGVTAVSGRGLGLAIVREKVEALGGEVSVETKPGMGALFRLTVPLAIATFRGILVRTGDQLFVLPTMCLRQVLRLDHDRLRTAGNRAVTDLGGQAVSVVWLAEVLGAGGRPQGPDSKAPGSKQRHPGVLLEWAGERVLFLVDEVLHDQEVLVKSLGPQLVRVRNVSGTAIIATGQLAPVLNAADLIRSAALLASPSPVCGEPEVKPKSILVAEDSITARTLLKGFLESAGYRVTTAVNGSEAFSILRKEAFDLVVSDVEMPRMTGFELTASIRADDKLLNLPVILVTGLDSREDRERGAEAGANAYLVKSCFDQSGLLAAVQRLI